MFWRRICLIAVILFTVLSYSIPTGTVLADIGIQSYSNTANEGNSLTINNPGTTGGEVLLAQITFNKPTQAGSDIAITPSGWTLVNRTNNLVNNLGQALFYKIAASNEPSSYTWNFAVGVKSAGGIIQYTGVNTTNPIVDYNCAFSFNNPMTVLSVDSEANSLLVVLYGITDNSTISGPDGMTSIYSYQNSSSLSIYAKYQIVTAGITGDRSANANPGSFWMAHLVTLRPASTPATYILTYNAGANGIISGTSPQTVNHGDNGSAITAIPNTGYHFVDWSDGSTANPRTDSNVTANISVIANFALDAITYTMAINTVGSGSVTKNPDQATYLSGDSVLLTAYPVTGWTFSSWSGDFSGNTNPESIIMNGNKAITATFIIKTYTLTYTAEPDGSISGISPQTVNHGTNGSAVTAIPNTGYHFVDWSDGSTANPRIDSNVTANIGVTANFAINKYTLITNTEGSGSISKNPNQSNYNHGTIIQLIAEPANGWNFSRWGGDISGSENPISVTMNNNNTVTAVFIQSAFTLTINVTGSGSVSRLPDQASYNSGTLVQLTPIHTTGYTFSGWSGDLSGSDNPATVIMDTDKKITATFTQNSGGGGFGDGGGGGGGPTGPGITNIGVYTNSEGSFNLNATAKSENGFVQLSIAKGVVAKNKDGQGLKTISIREAAEIPPPPAKSMIIGQVFDFGPDGATFSPPISLSFTYSRDSLPEGLPEKNLSIVTWDADAKAWVELGGTVDLAAGTITITVSHFSQYAVIAHTRPASFSIDSLTVSPTEAAVGDIVTVKVVAANTGDLPGEYTATLKINGDVESTQKTVIAGSSTSLLTFTINRDNPDIYEIDVNGKTASFTIQESPKVAGLNLKSLQISPVETSYGEEVSVSVVAENNGDITLRDTLELKIDGVVVDTRQIEIEPHSSKTVVFTTAEIEPGSRTIDINGQQANFIVKPLLSPQVKVTINWYLFGLLIFLVTTASSTLGFHLKLKPQEIPAVPPRVKKEER